MTILNIKNLPDPTRILADALETSEPLSIMELRGLGKAVWQGVDAAEHVDRERRSWG